MRRSAEGDSDREARMRILAHRLDFTVQKTAGHFTLIRSSNASTAVREEHLTIGEAEQVLETWKLRGFHGG
jgi:hypothetical protein